MEIEKEQKPSIKLTLNAKQEYQWEIKIVGLDVEELAKVNLKMVALYGKK
jgi:hypothetical protein